ncbi:hypothetical protein RI129_006818 [Pyrocoelia pectoralis]|uniref:Uncharacterized protein n=1 Tax=Pyrocoelia pectoralis TaxID=417401 RepID=A0AAN7ZPA6_9COLE
MTTEIDLLSSINNLRNNSSCSECDTFQLSLKRLSNCSHLLCDPCYVLCSNCPVCDTKHRSKYIKSSDDINTILSHVNSLYDFGQSIENDCRTKISYLFVSDSHNYKRHHNGETRLHKDCRGGNLAMVESLIKSGMDVNVQDFAMWTPLHEAVLNQRIEIVKLLLTNGALVNVPGLDYLTPLHSAVQEKNEEIVKLLIQYGASCMAYNKEGKTPLIKIPIIVLADLEPNNFVLNPMNYFADIPSYAVSKAGLNSLNKLPKLFDGIHFYFVNYLKQIVDDVEYTLEDVKTLIYLGGGKVDMRCPSGSNYNVTYPYHTCKTDSNATVSYYLIYDDTKTTKKKSFPNHIKYQTVQWLIASINNFSILT